VRATCVAPLHARFVPRACARASHMCSFALSQILHENVALAIDIAREHHDAPQVLIILGSLLNFIRTELLPPRQHQPLRTTPPPSSAVVCSLCSASHLPFCYTSAASAAVECSDCHQRRAGQRAPMRVCDILGAYALQLLRGETDSNAEHCKALLLAFEMVYSCGQFSLSKAALSCISNLVQRALAPPLQTDRFRTIKVPRWAAHALFPEYSCAVMMRCGDAFTAPCAAGLGWWVDSSSVRRCMHERVSSCFTAQATACADAAAAAASSVACNASDASISPHHSRLPFGQALSSVCITMLSMMQGDGSVDEAHAVSALLQQGVSLESIGCSIMHMINTSVIVAFDRRFWTTSPQRPQTSHAPYTGPFVDLPHDCHACVFVQLEDTVDAPLPRGSSSCAALAVTLSQAEEALVDGVQTVLDHPSSICSDLVRLGACLRSNHGSFARSLLSLTSNPPPPHAHHQPADASVCDMCPLCFTDPIVVRNGCGHGLCSTCWSDFAAATIRNSSTPEVSKGGDLAGASLVLDVKCPGDVNGKCRAAVEFAVLRRAVPKSVEGFVRTAMRSMSRLFLSGAAAIAQCVCGAVVCGTRPSSSPAAFV